MGYNTKDTMEKRHGAFSFIIKSGKRTLAMSRTNIGICIYSYNHAYAKYSSRQKLNNKETATTTTTVTITKRPALTIAAAADSRSNCGCAARTAYPSTVSTIRTCHIESSKGINPF